MSLYLVLYFCCLILGTSEAGYKTIKNKTKLKTVTDFYTTKREALVGFKAVLMDPPPFDFSRTVVKEGDETDNTKIAARAASLEVRQQLGDVS